MPPTPAAGAFLLSIPKRRLKPPGVAPTPRCASEDGRGRRSSRSPGLVPPYVSLLSDFSSLFHRLHTREGRGSKSPCFTSASPPGRITGSSAALPRGRSASPRHACGLRQGPRPPTQCCDGSVRLVPRGPSRRTWRGGQCISRGGWGLLSDQESPEITDLKTKGIRPRGLFNTRAVRRLCTFRNEKKGNFISEKGLGC